MAVSPIVAGNRLRCDNEKTGTVYAVDIGTGEEVWSYHRSQMTARLPRSLPPRLRYRTASSTSAPRTTALRLRKDRYRLPQRSTPTPAPAPGTGRNLAKKPSFTPSNNASATYTVNRTTDLGALALRRRPGFTFNASDQLRLQIVHARRYCRHRKRGLDTGERGLEYLHPRAITCRARGKHPRRRRPARLLLPLGSDVCAAH